MTALISTVPPLSPSRMEPQGRKELLMQATLRCLQQYGFQGISVRRICAQADVSVGLINHHYASKDDLVAQTYQHLTNRILQRLRAAMEQAGAHHRTRLKAFFVASFADEILDPGLLESWISFWAAVRSSPAMGQVHDASYAAYRTLLCECLEGLARELEWPHFNAPLAAIALSALLDGLWLESGLNPHVFTPAQGIQICEAWVDGLVCGGYRAYALPAA